MIDMLSTWLLSVPHRNATAQTHGNQLLDAAPQVLVRYGDLGLLCVHLRQRLVGVLGLVGGALEQDVALHDVRLVLAELLQDDGAVLVAVNGGDVHALRDAHGRPRAVWGSSSRPSHGSRRSQ